MPIPVTSASMPSAYVSLMPCAHLLIVLYVARGDQDSVRYQGPGCSGVGVLTAYRVAGLLFDGGLVEEAEGGRRGHDLDSPAAVAGQLDERGQLLRRGPPRRR